jgi:predicted nucleotidyltransferase
MKPKTIADIDTLLKHWAECHRDEIIEIILVGSQVNLGISDTLRPGSDVDLVILIRNDANSMRMMSELAGVGLEQMVLFHPIFMTRKEFRDKILIGQYKRMLKAGRRIVSEDVHPKGHCT